jgi:drug/metabolite transporter (DMT)-like permease
MIRYHHTGGSQIATRTPVDEWTSGIPPVIYTVIGWIALVSAVVLALQAPAIMRAAYRKIPEPLRWVRVIGLGVLLGAAGCFLIFGGLKYINPIPA